ncbi:TonB-dependent receptor, partial [Klebsiella pneumoniae]
SADDYLRPGKTSAFGYRSGYDSADRSWHNGVTAAGGDELLPGILVYSRRDGQETENYRGTVHAYPANSHSDAFPASGIWLPNAEQTLARTTDHSPKSSNTP